MITLRRHKTWVVLLSSIIRYFKLVDISSSVPCFSRSHMVSPLFTYYYPYSFSYFLLFSGSLPYPSAHTYPIFICYLFIHPSIHPSYLGRTHKMIRLILITKGKRSPKKDFIDSAEFLPPYFSFKDGIWEKVQAEIYPEQ